MTMLGALLCLVAAAAALDNGLGRVPAMGYNSWYDLECNLQSEQVLRDTVDAFIAHGLPALGYTYFNLDDCWATGRWPNGTLIADPKLFPSQTLKPLADYVHSKGLKFGTYTDRGPKTCAGRPAAQDHEQLDANTYRDWGVDYLKEDSCNASQDHNTAFQEYGKMRDALNATGRPILFSLCGWNSWYSPVGQTLGNSWRIAGDCNAWPSVYNAIRTNEVLAKYAGPGGFNDPDMLVGSSPGAAVHNTPDQARTQFSLWSVMAAPLLIGSNILNLSSWDLATYSNKDVIAIDQDPLGVQGAPIVTNCPSMTLEQVMAQAQTKTCMVKDVPNCQQIWAKPLADKSYAVNLVHFGPDPMKMTCDSSCLTKMGFSGQVTAKDLWAGTSTTGTSFSAQLSGNGDSATFKVSAA